MLLIGCGSTSHANLVPQPVAGIPAEFIGPSGVTEPVGATCRSPLRSPNGEVVLTLMRSGREQARPSIGWGDYAVAPGGSYGLQPDQLLRVECGSGRPTGAVPR
jgi:hypothetical protein